MIKARAPAIVPILMLLSAGVAADDSLRILTYPIGLVAGEIPVKVDLGAAGQPAELFLDGERACRLTAESPGCTVDLGPDPHVHLLEMVRVDPGQAEPQRVERWINRPGQEAELELAVVQTPGAGQCEAHLGWAHPLRQDPLELRLTLDGETLELDSDNRSASFPCSPSEVAHLLVASGVFPDGRRVEAATILGGGFGGETDVGLTAVPLVAEAGDPHCEPGIAESGSAIWPVTAERIEEGGFEAVFVLDPEAAFRPLRTHVLTSSSGIWLNARKKLHKAERLWFVIPNRPLHRVNGFAAGRPRWLQWLIEVGGREIEGPPRIADAVAASGLVAAAGPRRRVVVLILGDHAKERDSSQFTPGQAREYLAEVGVPLVVLRHSKVRDDGWPAGLAAVGQVGVAKNIPAVREVLDRQCIAWFPGELAPSRMAEILPTGVHVAGRRGDAPASPESVWARAEIGPEGLLPDSAEGRVVERLDITAVTVLVSAVDAAGRPVTDLTAGDLVVLEDGTAAAVLELNAVTKPGEAAEPGATLEAEERAGAPREDPEARALPVAVYVDRSLGGGSDLRAALQAVAAEALRLSAFGPVEVVVADREGVTTILGPTRDSLALAQVLDGLVRKGAGLHAVERIRRRFLQDIRQIPKRATAGSRPPPAGNRVTFAARTAAAEEDLILSRALDRLRLWARRETGHQAGLLLVVGGGFDEDPTLFYQGYIDKHEPHNSSRVREQLLDLQQSASVGALGRELAGTGWRVLAVAGQATGSPTFAAEAKTDKFFTFLSTAPEAVRADDPDWLLLEPVASQRHLAQASGGEAVVGTGGLRSALDNARGWYLLSYQVARPPDGAVHDLELRARRSGIELSTSRVVTAATSEGQAEARALRLLGGAMERGELQVDLEAGAPVARTPERLTARMSAKVEFAALGEALAGGKKLLRVTVAVMSGGSEPTVFHRRESVAGARKGWIYTFPVEWSPREGGRLAVTVEELRSGVWGGDVVELPTSP